jgi:hypothetical protein
MIFLPHGEYSLLWSRIRAHYRIHNGAHRGFHQQLGDALTVAQCKKCSYSAQQTNCVEVTKGELVQVRDTKDRPGGHLTT